MKKPILNPDKFDQETQNLFTDDAWNKLTEEQQLEATKEIETINNDNSIKEILDAGHTVNINVSDITAYEIEEK